MGVWTRWNWVLIAALPFVSQAQVNLRSLDRDVVGPKAQVLVIGTVHLSEMSGQFNPKALQGVLDRLVRFKPDIVTIEALSGEACDLASRHPSKFDILERCESTDAAKAATGFDVPTAIAEIDKTLKTCPAQPSPAQRRRLAALFLAANDRYSAYVQWLQLPEPDRHAADGLDDKLVAMLTNIGTRNDEASQLAAQLAAMLGLQRVYAVDDHTGDNIHVLNEKAFGIAVQAAWDAEKGKIHAYEQHRKILSDAQDLLPLFRYINSPEYETALAELNVTAPLRSKSPEGYPQMFVAGWEIRNLRMVANVAETFRESPRARVVSIVGVSHKPWFDHLLGELPGVDIVNAESVLK